MLVKLLLLPITLYQRLLSPLLAPRCRFYPSCSEYARLALLTQPTHKALVKIAWRIMRCQPLSKGGIDWPAKEEVDG